MSRAVNRSASAKTVSIDKDLRQVDFSCAGNPRRRPLNMDAPVMDALSPIPDVADPLALFRTWFDQAEAREPDLHNAMSLATATAEGRPSVRLVLLKDFSSQGFVFYTNTESRKGTEIAANPAAAVCFHWKSLRRQVRIEGDLVPVTAAEADAYWATRPRESQLAAWASAQSRPMPSRALLQTRVAECEARFAGKPVPRPDQWTGYCLVPRNIEFWHDVRNRLHDRLIFRRIGDDWHSERLYP